MSRRRLVIEADGGSRGNPGPAGYGALVRDGATGEVLAEVADALGVTTNNVAEYEGLVAGLIVVREIDPAGESEVEVRMDSKLVVEQMSGRWSIKHPSMRELAVRARALLPRGGVTFTWVPRAQNQAADALANRALDAQAAGRPARIDTRSGQPWTRTAAPTGVAGTTAAAADTLPFDQAPAADAPPPVRTLDDLPLDALPLDDLPRAASLTRGEVEVVREQPAVNPMWQHGPDVGEPTSLLLVRHGVTEATVARRFAGSGGEDLPLTALGLAQADAIAAELRARGGADVVITSPMRRSRQTAVVIADALGLAADAVTVMDDLRECAFGIWEGLTVAEVMRRDPVTFSRWLADVEVAPAEGESFAAVDRRVASAMEHLIETQTRRRVVVVSHNTPVVMTIIRALGAPLQSAHRLEVRPCSLTTVAQWADGACAVRGVGEQAHLRGTAD